MKAVLLKSAVVALLSVAASLLIVKTIVPILGGSVDGNAILMSTICPLAIAWPASAYTFWQKRKLSVALYELRTAHGELAAMHLELTAAHARLEEKARRDEMTGMLNRATFLGALRDERSRSRRPGTLLIIDADRFKQVNDNHGHQTGDRALLAVARAIHKAARENDIVGRIGGEEFAVFLPETPPREAEIVAERIRRSVEDIPFLLPDGDLLPLTVSIGGVTQEPDVPLSDLMRDADRGLYAAKRSGRNRVVFETSLPAAA